LSSPALTTGETTPVRVIAGEARGRRLRAPAGDGTRPTSDFVREAIFNSLGSHADLRDATVLDLFAGTGALGIEALSRGASSVTFVESARDALDAIATNLVATGFEGRATVVRGDATVVALPPTELVFVDPPYAFDGWTRLLGRLHEAGAGMAVLESDREIDAGAEWRVLRVKRYGGTVVTLASPRVAAGPLSG